MRERKGAVIEGDQDLPERLRESRSEIAYAKDLWERAGGVCGGVLKQEIGGGEFSDVLKLMDAVSKGSEWREDTSARYELVYLFEGGRLRVPEVRGHELVLEPLKPKKGGIKKLGLLRRADDYMIGFLTVQPGRKNGCFNVQITSDEEGKIQRIYYSCDRWVEMKVPGGFVRKHVKITKGEIIPGLQIVQGPPQI